jgi:hypothetical protein
MMAAAKSTKRATPGELSALDDHILMLAGKRAKKSRDQLEPGVYEVQRVFAVRGTVTVGENGNQQKNERPGLEQVVALMFAAMPAEQRAKVHRGVVKACAAWVADGAEPVIKDERTAEAKALLGAIMHQATSEVRGAVTGELSAEVVSERVSKAA